MAKSKQSDAPQWVAVKPPCPDVNDPIFKEEFERLRLLKLPIWDPRRPAVPEDRLASAVIRGLYRGRLILQDLRIRLGNQLSAILKVKCGKLDGLTELVGLTEEDRKILQGIRDAHKLMGEVAASAALATVADTEEDTEAPALEADEAIGNVRDTIVDVANTKARGARLTPKKAEMIYTEAVMDASKHFYDRITGMRRGRADGTDDPGAPRDQSSRKRPTKETFKGGPILTTFEEYSLAAQYYDALLSEQQATERLKQAVAAHPIGSIFMSWVGVGPVLAGMLISEVDITKARHPSSLWKYCGLDVAPVNYVEPSTGAEEVRWEARGAKEGHLVWRPYLAKIKGKEGEYNNEMKLSLTYKPDIKRMLLGVGAPCFVKKGKVGKLNPVACPWVETYYNYKHRLETDPKHATKSKGHRNRMALRYMMKMFLIDVYTTWRKELGLEVSVPYHERLGHVHGVSHS